MYKITLRMKECMFICFIFQGKFPHGRKGLRQVFIKEATAYAMDIIPVLISKIADETRND